MIVNEVLTGLLILLVSSVLYSKYKLYEKRVKCNEDRDAIARYLLSDDNEYSSTKPNLWIHIPETYNARCWESWGSRSSSTVNQPYIGLCVGSIISKCSQDFNICAVSDENIRDFLPDWHIELTKTADPIRSKLRSLAMAKILYKHGGILVPCSFICNRSLRPAFDTAFLSSGMLAFPMLNDSSARHHEIVLSDKFIGCRARCEVMKQMTELLQLIVSTDYTEASVIEGRVQLWLQKAKERGLVTTLSPALCGVLDSQGNLLTTERLMSDENIELPMNTYGMMVPSKALLERKMYGWFPMLDAVDSTRVDNLIGRVLTASVL